MLRPIAAVLIAAAIAAAITFLSASVGKVDAGPVVKPVAIAMQECAQRPWPYLGCVGTQFGNPKIRLVTAERFSN